jgi:hypothetical protein
MSAAGILILVAAGSAASVQDEERQGPWQPSSFAVAFRNDNYTPNREAGERGRYFGPDDFLTMAWLVRARWGEWRAALNHDTVTSRRFDFRYDLLTGLIERSFSSEPFVLRYGLGLLLKGDFGGQAVQNYWHRSRDLAEIVLPHRDAGFAVVTTLAGDWVGEALLVSVDRLSTTVELRVYSAHVPSRISPKLRYQLQWPWLELELLAGWRFFLNEAAGYSEMVRHGPMGALNLRVALPGDLFVEAGLGLIPVRNVEPEPDYLSRDYRWLPQICMGVSWKNAGESVAWMLDP